MLAAGLTAGNAFFNPTVQAVIQVLTTEEQRLAANSVGGSTGRLVQILASIAAWGLIGLVGTGPAFAVNAASFVVSALLISCPGTQECGARVEHHICNGSRAHRDGELAFAVLDNTCASAPEGRKEHRLATEHAPARRTASTGTASSPSRTVVNVH